MTDPVATRLYYIQRAIGLNVTYDPGDAYTEESIADLNEAARELESIVRNNEIEENLRKDYIVLGIGTLGLSGDKITASSWYNTYKNELHPLDQAESLILAVSLPTYADQIIPTTDDSLYRSVINQCQEKELAAARDTIWEILKNPYEAWHHYLLRIVLYAIKNWE